MKNILTLLAVFLITACTSSYVNNPGFTDGRYGMTLVTYEAVDDLMAQAIAKDLVTDETPILVASFVDIDDLNDTSPLGLAVTEQFITRLVQLNYKVKEVRLRDYLEVSKKGEFAMGRDSDYNSRTTKAAAIVTGTFVESGNSVIFNSRFISLKDAETEAAQDFIFEKDEQIEALLNANDNDGDWDYGWYIDDDKNM